MIEKAWANASYGLTVDLKVRSAYNNDPITLLDLANSLCNKGAMEDVYNYIDGGLKTFLQGVVFESTEIKLVTQPMFAIMVQAKIRVDVLNFYGRLIIERSPTTGKWGFGFGLQVSYLHITDLVPSMMPDFPQIADVKLVFATFEDHYFRFGTRSSAVHGYGSAQHVLADENSFGRSNMACIPPDCIQVTTGFALSAKVNMTGPLAPAKNAPWDNAFLSLSYNVETLEFKIAIGIVGTFPLGSRSEYNTGECICCR